MTKLFLGLQYSCKLVISLLTHIPQGTFKSLKSGHTLPYHIIRHCTLIWSHICSFDDITVFVCIIHMSTTIDYDNVSIDEQGC